MVPVVLVPQVAIGAFGRIQTVPRFVKGSTSEIAAASIMNVSWSADHRVIDGATVAKFSNQWKHLIEHPPSILAELR
jgi:2-oxoisovalerate dehydrogenase E2 component (dihydrolipoyl transacylase)